MSLKLFFLFFGTVTPGQTTYLSSIKGSEVNMKEIFPFMNFIDQQKENKAADLW
jgi:hypothetical protein